MKKKLLTILMTMTLLMSPSVYYYGKQVRENAKLNQYLSQINLDSEGDPWEKAVLVSRQLRQDFEVDENKFSRLKMSERPFLRETSDYLLQVKEGLCGEGTRVLVNLLLSAGYDATRITLYDQYLNASHTLVSLKIDNQEYLIDSINTPSDINSFINTNKIDAKSFKIVKYDDDVVKRTADYDSLKSGAADLSHRSSQEAYFYDKFKYYSYEALPFTKLFNVLGLNTRMLNFTRPPKLISSLAEKPYMIMSLFWFLLASMISAGLIYGLSLKKGSKNVNKQ